LIDAFVPADSSVLADGVAVDGGAELDLGGEAGTVVADESPPHAAAIRATVMSSAARALGGDATRP